LAKLEIVRFLKSYSFKPDFHSKIFFMALSYKKSAFEPKNKHRQRKNGDYYLNNNHHYFRNDRHYLIQRFLNFQWF
jgi:hypothetical protein